jgi:hypothetical protein
MPNVSLLSLVQLVSLLLLLLDGTITCVSSLVITVRPSRSWTSSRTTRTAIATATSLRVSSATDGNSDRRYTEFMDLGPILETETRRARIEREIQTRAQFVPFGDPLWQLRNQMEILSRRLIKAIEEGQDELVENTRKMLQTFEKKDPELVYMLELSDMQQAQQDGRAKDVDRHRRLALAARSCLPHFNLNGLWVGKYGHHGYELVNVSNCFL